MAVINPTPTPARSDISQGDWWYLFTDGACRGNPGDMGAGALLVSPSGEETPLSRFLGHGTNQTAELEALNLGLWGALKKGVRQLKVFTDSAFVVALFTPKPGHPGKFKYRLKAEHLKPLWGRAKWQLTKFAAWEVAWIPRKNNWQADSLANRALDRAAGKQGRG